MKTQRLQLLARELLTLEEEKRRRILSHFPSEDKIEISLEIKRLKDDSPRNT